MKSTNQNWIRLSTQLLTILSLCLAGSNGWSETDRGRSNPNTSTASENSAEAQRQKGEVQAKQPTADFLFSSTNGNLEPYVRGGEQDNYLIFLAAAIRTHVPAAANNFCQISVGEPGEQLEQSDIADIADSLDHEISRANQDHYLNGSNRTTSQQIASGPSMGGAPQTMGLSERRNPLAHRSQLSQLDSITKIAREWARQAAFSIEAPPANGNDGVVPNMGYFLFYDGWMQEIAKQGGNLFDFDSGPPSRTFSVVYHGGINNSIQQRFNTLSFALAVRFSGTNHKQSPANAKLNGCQIYVDVASDMDLVDREKDLIRAEQDYQPIQQVDPIQNALGNGQQIQIGRNEARYRGMAGSYNSNYRGGAATNGMRNAEPRISDPYQNPYNPNDGRQYVGGNTRQANPLNQAAGNFINGLSNSFTGSSLLNGVMGGNSNSQATGSGPYQGGGVQSQTSTGPYQGGGIQQNGGSVGNGWVEPLQNARENTQGSTLMRNFQNNSSLFGQESSQPQSTAPQQPQTPNSGGDPAYDAGSGIGNGFSGFIGNALNSLFGKTNSESE